MPDGFIYETAITIDHETKTARIDTTKAALQSFLGVLAKKDPKVSETTNPDDLTNPYRSFEVPERYIKIRPPSKRTKAHIEAMRMGRLKSIAGRDSGT